MSLCVHTIYYTVCILQLLARVANIVFQKSLETSRSAQRTRYPGLRACPGTWGASWVEAFFPFLSGVTEFICKIESKWGAYWWFCDGMCKKCLGFKHIHKSSRKVCSITKGLRSRTKVWKLATLLLVKGNPLSSASTMLHADPHIIYTEYTIYCIYLMPRTQPHSFISLKPWNRGHLTVRQVADLYWVLNCNSPRISYDLVYWMM